MPGAPEGTTHHGAAWSLPEAIQVPARHGRGVPLRRVRRSGEVGIGAHEGGGERAIARVRSSVARMDGMDPVTSALEPLCDQARSCTASVAVAICLPEPVAAVVAHSGALPANLGDEDAPVTALEIRAEGARELLGHLVVVGGPRTHLDAAARAMLEQLATRAVPYLQRYRGEAIAGEVRRLLH